MCSTYMQEPMGTTDFCELELHMIISDHMEARSLCMYRVLCMNNEAIFPALYLLMRQGH